MTLDNNRQDRLKRLADRFGYVFRDISLLDKALTHKSFANENHELCVKNNERFEFLGDSVIDLIVSRYLLHEHRGMAEGELSKIRSQIVKESSLARFARVLGLGDFLLLGKGEDTSGGRDKNSLLADSFEAVAASVFLDSSFEVTYQVFLGLLKEPMDEITAHKQIDDYKGQLQRYCQARVMPNPQYRLVNETGPEHEKTFEIQVLILHQSYGTGTGKTKKEAEQAAAMQSYETLIANDDAGIDPTVC